MSDSMELVDAIEKKLFSYSHQVDDLQKNLATFRRAAKNSISRLENALEANDDERTDIVKEFIEITIHYLNEALEKTSRRSD